MTEPLSLIAERFLQDDVPTAAPTLSDDGESSLFSVILSNVFLFFLIFGLSATVRVQDLKHQLTNRFAIFTGVAMQFLIMPFLGFSSVMLFKEQGFTQAMGISLLVVTASPGGSYSNWWCSLFNAELALSVAMTSVSSVLSVGLLPANLFIYSWLAYTVVDSGDGEDLDVIASLDFTGIFITLAVVLVGIVSGLYVGYKVDSTVFKERANKVASICGLLLILVSVFFGSGAGDADTTFWNLPWSFYLGTALPCIVGMTLANVISRSFRLSPPETVAISIECCYQNTAIATSVAVTMFSDPNERAEAIVVPLFYGLVEAVIIGIYCVWAWKVGWTKAPSDEKLCVVVSRTYEGGIHDHDAEEWEGELPEGFVARLFVPRAVEKRLGNGEVEGTEGTKSTKSKVEPETPRDRLESGDAKAGTNLVAPPGTPDTCLDTIAQEQDLETGVSDDSMSSQEAEKTDLYKKYDGSQVEDGYPTDEQSQSSSLAEKKPSSSASGMAGLIGITETPKLPAQPSNKKLLEDETAGEETVDEESAKGQDETELPNTPSIEG